MVTEMGSEIETEMGSEISTYWNKDWCRNLHGSGIERGIFVKDGGRMSSQKFLRKQQKTRCGPNLIFTMLDSHRMTK